MYSEELEAGLLRELNEMAMNEQFGAPEPQFRNFSKHMAFTSNSLKDIVHLTNSHGVQLRNDVKFWLQMGADKSNEFSDHLIQKQSPVVEALNLNLFKSFDEIVNKLRQLPSEWTIIQITKKFSPYAAVPCKENENTSFYLTRFPCGELIKRVEPYTVLINSESNVTELLVNLIKMRREFYNSNSRSNQKLRKEYSNSDNVLKNFISDLENIYLKEWKCLLGGRLKDESLENETLELVKETINNFLEKHNTNWKCSEKCLDLVYQITLGARVLKNTEMLEVLKFAFSGITVNMNELTRLIENLKLLNLNRNSAVKRAEKHPVILITDTEFEVVPWEMTSLLVGQPVCRILSLHLLYALFKHHQPYIVNGYRLLHVDYVYCLINPSKDLENCEKNMKGFLSKKLPWVEIEVGKIPEPKHLISKFRDSSFYLYCGHGSGAQYFKAGDLKNAFVKGILLLCGCSSNLPKSSGGRTPYQNDTQTYLTNGCPCIIGCLYDINSNDADAACLEILTNIMPLVKEELRKTVADPKEPNVLKALNIGKCSCNKYWSTCSFVARGLPCKIVVGNSEKEAILKKCSKLM